MISSFKPLFCTWPSIFLFVFITMGVIIPTGLLGDPGTFWHIRTGEWMIDHLQVLRTDPFSQSQSDWIPTQWFAEIVMALAYRSAGFTGITTLSSLLIATWVSILARRWFLSGMHPILVWFFAILVLMVGAIHFLARPLLINYIGMTMLAYFILDFEKGRGKVTSLLWSFPLAIVWANSHGGYLGGLASLGLASSIWLTRFLFNTGPIKDYKSFRILTFANLLWIAAPCISPFGFGLYQEWFKIWFKLDLASFIIEHKPPELLEFQMLAIYLVLATVIGFFLFSSQRNKYLGILINILAWFVLSLQRVRNGPLFICVAAVMFEEIWAELVARGWVREDWIVRVPVKPSLKIIGFTGLIVIAVFYAGTVGWFCVGLDATKWPTDLIEPLQTLALQNQLREKQSPSIKIYNELNDGGFLIFYAPAFKVFQDDRCEIHAFREGYTEGGWLKKQFELQLNSPESLIIEIEKKGIHLAIVPKKTAVSQSLAKLNSWKLIFEGKTHFIWLLSP